MRTCLSQECPQRKTLLGRIKSAELAVKTCLEGNQLELESRYAISLIATALMGNREQALSDPANYCKLVIRLAFDPHWAPSDDWPYSQSEMAAPLEGVGLKQALDRRLSRADAESMAAGDQGLLQAIRQTTEGDFASLDFWIGELRECTASRAVDHEGNVSWVHGTADGMNRRFDVSLTTRGQYKEVQDWVELDAGMVLRTALIAMYGLKLGNIKKLPPGPADIEISQQGADSILVQHTKADCRPWPLVGKRNSERPSYSSSERPEALFDELANSLIRKGRTQYADEERAKLILLLDGGLLRLPEDWIREFALRRADQISASGYFEVWYACMWSRKAFRLSRTSPFEYAA